MKKLVGGLIIFIFLFIGPSERCAAADKWGNLLQESARVFEEMTRMPDEGLPKSYLNGCHAIAIFPNTIQAGLGIGGKYGQGVIIARNKKTRKWGEPAVYSIYGGSIGWQIGGEAIDIVLLIMSDSGLEGLLSSKFKLGGDASVAAGPVGRSAEASADIQFKGGILSYSRAKGLFIGLKLEGAVLAFHEEGNRSLYGKYYSAREILIDHRAKAPEYAARLLKDLSRY